MSVVPHQPKWRKLLFLKREPKTSEPKPVTNEVQADVSHSEIESKNGETLPPIKKRTRSEEEIALRKAKKLKSKSRESQEWKELSGDHRTFVSSELATSDDSRLSSGQSGVNADRTSETVDTSIAKSNVVLLSTKAKEIAKARRDEKVQDKPKKTSKKRAKESAEFERKSSLVLEYIDRYGAHIDSGAPWKFKKQHQNWIVKHLYRFPWKNDELVIRYLGTVQGKVRDRLSADAKRILEDSEGKYAESLIYRAKSVMQALNQ
jgi:hypothetical protein